jgi:hypothetical protein
VQQAATISVERIISENPRRAENVTATWCIKDVARYPVVTNRPIAFECDG